MEKAQVHKSLRGFYLVLANLSTRFTEEEEEGGGGRTVAVLSLALSVDRTRSVISPHALKARYTTSGTRSFLRARLSRLAVMRSHRRLAKVSRAYASRRHDQVSRRVLGAYLPREEGRKEGGEESTPSNAGVYLASPFLVIGGVERSSSSRIPAERAGLAVRRRRLRRND